METFVRKITSRKFWLAAVGVVVGVAIAMGVEPGEIDSVAATVENIVRLLIGAGAAVGSIGIYNAAEAKVDAAHKTDQ